MLTEDFQGFLWHNIIQLKTIYRTIYNYEFIIVCMTLKKFKYL